MSSAHPAGGDDDHINGNLDCEPLIPAGLHAVPFPRPQEQWELEARPTFPLVGCSQQVAIWAGRIATKRWLELAGNRSLFDLPFEVYVWAVVDAARDRSLQHRREKIADDARRLFTGLPPRRTRTWMEWLDLTQTFFVHAWANANDALGMPRTYVPPGYEMIHINNLCQIVIDSQWSVLHDLAPPPPAYDLHRPFNRALLGICNPYDVDNAYLMITIGLPASPGEDRSWAKNPIEEARWEAWLDHRWL